MTTMIVWLLISTSNGADNRGTQTTLAMFPDKVDCERTKMQLPSDYNRLDCVTGRVLVPK